MNIRSEMAVIHVTMALIITQRMVLDALMGLAHEYGYRSTSVLINE